ncbi:hypothetical protein ABKN59_006549 [Abortiporus biennis]
MYTPTLIALVFLANRIVSSCAAPAFPHGASNLDSAKIISSLPGVPSKGQYSDPDSQERDQSGALNGKQIGSFISQKVTPVVKAVAPLAPLAMELLARDDNELEAQTAKHLNHFGNDESGAINWDEVSNFLGNGVAPVVSAVAPVAEALLTKGKSKSKRRNRREGGYQANTRKNQLLQVA